MDNVPYKVLHIVQDILCKELLNHKEDMLEKPHFLILSKSDIKQKKTKNRRLPDLDVIEISSINRSGLNKAKKLIYEKLCKISV
ncbi:uncharacterized protein METZ01_LOCUS376001 [marine metagenome]|uniref:Uncharacterized protein n=1 Tax=marine metagenome TaxID=408172 RepID=A0A382TNP0_9ZZZZ